MFKTRKSKIVACSVAGALIVGAAGVGASTDLKAIIQGNHLAASVSTDIPDPSTDASVVIEGKAMDHEFDVTKSGDAVQKSWTIKNEGAKDASIEGTFDNLKMLVDDKEDKGDTALAENLKIEYGYGKNDDGETAWFDGGTFADPKAIGDVVENGFTTELGAGKSERLDVRVTLENPFNLIANHTDGQTLAVQGDFDVTWSAAGGN